MIRIAKNNEFFIKKYRNLNKSFTYVDKDIIFYYTYHDSKKEYAKFKTVNKKYYFHENFEPIFLDKNPSYAPIFTHDLAKNICINWQNMTDEQILEEFDKIKEIIMFQ